MKKILIFIIVIAFNSLFLGCKKKEKHQEIKQAQVLIDLTKPNLLDSLISPRQLMTEVEYIVLKPSESFILTAAHKIQELDGKLFILDRNKQILFAYDLNGNFIGQVGNKGQGPEEYVEALDFVVNPLRKSVLIFCRGSHSILEFKSDLSFVRKSKIDGWYNQIGLLESENLALYSFLDENEGLFNIKLHDYNGKFLKFKMEHPLVKGYVPSDYSGFISGNYYTYPLSSIIYKIDENGIEDFPAFEINFPNKRSEDLRFDHTGFRFNNMENPEAILTKFEVGREGKELMFYYSFFEGTYAGFTLGVILSGGQSFGHLSMKHWPKTKNDIFNLLFFAGPYNLPSYNVSNGFYYVATNIDAIAAFSDQIKNENTFNHLTELDPDLYKILIHNPDLEYPIIMKFKLRERI